MKRSWFYDITTIAIGVIIAEVVMLFIQFVLIALMAILMPMKGLGL